MVQRALRPSTTQIEIPSGRTEDSQGMEFSIENGDEASEGTLTLDQRLPLSEGARRTLPRRDVDTHVKETFPQS
nr:hypothetical protein CFP56_10086 [Quercus suber]